AAEDSERLAVGREVAAERVELVVATRDEFLDERLILLGLGPRALGLRAVRAPKSLAAEAPLEALGRRRLDEHRVCEVVREGRRPARHRNPDPLRGLELRAFALDS